MNDITFFQPHSRVHCTNSRNPYTSRKDGFTTVGFFFDLGKTASGQWGTKFFQEKQPLKNILAVLKLTKSNTNLFNRKITIMKVKVSNYAPKAFLSDTQQIWHMKCLIRLIILAKAREMLLSCKYRNKLIGKSQLPFPWSARGQAETNLQDRASINI